MAFYIHLHTNGDKEFSTTLKRDTAIKAIAKVLTTYGFTSADVHLQALDDKTFTASDETTMTQARPVLVEGAVLSDPIAEPVIGQE